MTRPLRSTISGTSSVTLAFFCEAARASRSVCLLAPLAAMFAGLPPSSSDLAERKSVVPPSPPADRRRVHRESAYFVVARRGRAPPLALYTLLAPLAEAGAPLLSSLARRRRTCLL